MQDREDRRDSPAQRPRLIETSPLAHQGFPHEPSGLSGGRNVDGLVALSTTPSET